MGNVLYTYDEILKVSVLWQYWDSYKPPVRNPFESNEEAFKFISQFVDESGKDFNNELSNEFEKIKDRSLHTLSTYFLGIIIYHKFPKIQNIIDTEIKKYQELNLKSKINFQYLWYLISIFHDFGFRYENDNTFPDLVAFQVGKKKLTVPPATIPHEIAKVWRKYLPSRKEQELNAIMVLLEGCSYMPI